jgi:hypothetical protein
MPFELVLISRMSDRNGDPPERRFGSLLSRDPVEIVRCPFPVGAAARETRAKPSLWNGAAEFYYCVQRAMHIDTAPFGDDTGARCIRDFKTYWSAVVHSDEESLQAIEQRRLGVYDPLSLPWKPRPQYLDYLQKQRRVKDDVSS